MQQLSGLDAAFLYLETPNAPMHVGGVAIFEPPVDKKFDIENYRNFLTTRLHVVRTTRERLVNVPMNLGYPYWIEDPNFDIDFHLHHMALPQPGTWQQLSKLAAHIFSIPLDRSRPLWEMTFVEGLDAIAGVKKGTFALISKIHHSAIDGASGAEMQGAVLDTQPNATQSTSSEPWTSEPIPSERELLHKALMNAVKNPIELARMLPKTIKSATVAGALWQVKKIKPPQMPFTAPRTRFNNTVTPHRVWDSALFSLSRIKTIKNAFDVTLNDAVLTICATALRRYLIDKGELPEVPLTAMLPVNIRDEDEKGTQGNRVSAYVASLATDEPDLKKRVQKIHKSTSSSKIYHNATDAKKLIDYSTFIPYSLGNLASRLYTRMDISQKHTPFYNVIITNVPGPQIPLYMYEAKMYATFGTAPILDGIGLIIVIQSYSGTLSISSTSCREIMPDLPVFIQYVRDAVEELEKLTNNHEDETH